MTIGSAASQAGTVPAVPLSPFPVARRSKGVAIFPQSWGDAAPPRHVPLQKAAGGPPRGHLLLAASDAATALDVQRLLAGSAYRLVGPAGSVEEIDRLVDLARQPLTAALVHLDLPDAEAIADRLAAKAVPIVWLASSASALLPGAHGAAPVVHRPFSLDDVNDAVDASLRRRVGLGMYVTPPPQGAWPRIFPQL
jgi:hypothetical protein